MTTVDNFSHCDGEVADKQYGKQIQFHERGSTCKMNVELQSQKPFEPEGSRWVTTDAHLRSKVNTVRFRVKGHSDYYNCPPSSCMEASGQEEINFADIGTKGVYHGVTMVGKKESEPRFEGMQLNLAMRPDRWESDRSPPIPR